MPKAWYRTRRRHFPGLLHRNIGSPCAYCGVTMTRPASPALTSSITRDHAFPANRGFRLSDFNGLNRVLCCYRCNGQKKHYDIVEWWHRLAEGGDPRAARVWHVIVRFWRAGALMLPLARGSGEHWDAVRRRLLGSPVQRSQDSRPDQHGCAERGEADELVKPEAVEDQI